jgi:hypothetical protein
MVKFCVFSPLQTKVVEKRKQTWLGTVVESVNVPLYATTRDMYEAIAAFATEAGDRLVGISGSPYGENHMHYLAGEVVVWYREKA